MQIAPLAAALLGSQLVIHVADRVPHLNVEVTCKASTAADKAMGLAEPQSYEDCMRDETTAQQQLTSIWPTTTGPVRDQCQREATVDANQSYVDLLTCIQAADIVNASSSPSTLRGASKNRNTR